MSKDIKSKFSSLFKKDDDSGKEKTKEKEGGLNSFLQKIQSAASGQPQPNVAPLADMDAAKITLSSPLPFHTSPIHASGPKPGEKGTFRWFRSSPGGRFLNIAVTLINAYTPSIDDVGASICCQFVPNNGFPSAFAEIGPIQADPRLVSAANALFINHRCEMILPANTPGAPSPSRPGPPSIATGPASPSSTHSPPPIDITAELGIVRLTITPSSTTITPLSTSILSSTHSSPSSSTSSSPSISSPPSQTSSSVSSLSSTSTISSSSSSSTTSTSSSSPSPLNLIPMDVLILNANLDVQLPPTTLAPSLQHSQLILVDRSTHTSYSLSIPGRQLRDALVFLLRRLSDEQSRLAHRLDSSTSPDPLAQTSSTQSDSNGSDNKNILDTHDKQETALANTSAEGKAEALQATSSLAHSEVPPLDEREALSKKREGNPDDVWLKQGQVKAITGGSNDNDKGNSEVTRELEKLQQRIDRVNEREAKMRAEMVSLKMALREAEKRAGDAEKGRMKEVERVEEKEAEIAQLKSQLTNAVAAEKALDVERKQERVREEEAQQREEEHEKALVAFEASAKAERDLMKKEIDELTKQVSLLDEERHRRGAVEADLVELKKVLQTTREELKVAKETIEEKVNEVNKQTKGVQAVSATLSTTKKALEESETKAKELGEKVVSLEKQGRESMEITTRTKAEMEEVTEKAKKFENMWQTAQVTIKEMEKERDKLKEETSRRTASSTAELTRRLEEKEKALSEKAKQLGEKNRALKDAEKKLKESEKKRDEAEKEKQVAMSKLSSLTATNEENATNTLEQGKCDQCEQYVKKLTEIEKAAEEMKAEKEVTCAKIDEMGERLGSLTTSLHEKDTLLDKLKQEVGEYQVKMRQMEGEHKEAMDVATKRLEASLVEQKSENEEHITKLSREISELKMKVVVLESEKADLTAEAASTAMTHARALRTAREAAAEELEQAVREAEQQVRGEEREKMRVVREEMARLQAELDELVGLKGKLTAYEQDLVKVRSDLRDKHTAEAKAQGEIQRQKELLIAVETKLKDAEIEIETMKGKNANLVTRIDELTGKLTQEEARSKEIATLKEEQTAMKANVKAMEAKVKQLEQEVEEAKAEAELSKLTLEDKEKDWEREKSEEESHQKQLVDEIAELKTKVEKNEAMKEEAVKAERDRATRDMDVLVNELNGLKTMVTELEKRPTAEDLAALRTERNHYVQKNKSLSQLVEKMLRDNQVDVSALQGHSDTKSPTHSGSMASNGIEDGRTSINNASSSPSSYSTPSTSSSSSSTSSSLSTSSSMSSAPHRTPHSSASPTLSLSPVELSELPRIDLVPVVHALEAELHTVRSERDDAVEALTAYKRALEQQIAKSKADADAHATLQSTTSMSTAQLQKQYVMVRQLANSLTETLQDKDIALSHMRQCNRILGSRIRELEVKVEAVERACTCGAASKESSSPSSSPSLANPLSPSSGINRSSSSTST